MFRSPLADGGVLILLILLFAAPKRLPMLTRSIGESIKEFRGGVAHHEDEKHLTSSSADATTTPAPASSASVPAAPSPSVADPASAAKPADARDTVA